MTESKKVGRPLKIDDTVLAKLEHAFKIGANDVEACEYAKIHPATLYRYQEQNKEFCEQKEAWKRNPIFKAKYTIYNNLDDPKVAQWLLERKDGEYSNKSKVELQSQGINIVVADEEHKKMLEDL